MSCQQYQDEMLLLVGADPLPDELQRHLNSCPSCRAFWSELTSLADAVGNDKDFFLDQATIESAVGSVDRKIDQLELKKVTDMRSAWFSYVPAAAAVVLLVGLSFAVYMLGWFGSNGELADSAVEDTLLAGGAADVIDETDLDYILGGMAVDRSVSTSEILYEDLTDDELQYLEDNFDIGDIL